MKNSIFITLIVVLPFNFLLAQNNSYDYVANTKTAVLMNEKEVLLRYSEDEDISFKEINFSRENVYKEGSKLASFKRFKLNFKDKTYKLKRPWFSNKTHLVDVETKDKFFTNTYSKGKLTFINTNNYNMLSSEEQEILYAWTLFSNAKNLTRRQQSRDIVGSTVILVSAITLTSLLD